MENFKKGGHIDPDLFDIFVRGEVFRKYAESYLLAEQVDC